MRSVTWGGRDFPISAGWRYSSGALHAAYDVPMPNGTPLFSPCDGEVVDLVTGVPNVPGGSGSPSNWVTIAHKVGGEWRTHYLQHCSAIVVKRGQKVRAGDPLTAKSGNSGNSSGPHLHWAYMKGRHGAATRYSYMNNGGASAIYPPTKGEDEPMPSADDIAKAVWNTEIDLNPGGKPDKVTARKALRMAVNQSEKAAGKPAAPGVEDIWNAVLDKDNDKTARALIRETWRKITGKA